MSRSRRRDIAQPRAMMMVTLPRLQPDGSWIDELQVFPTVEEAERAEEAARAVDQDTPPVVEVNAKINGKTPWLRECSSSGRLEGLRSFDDNTWIWETTVLDPGEVVIWRRLTDGRWDKGTKHYASLEEAARAYDDLAPSEPLLIIGDAPTEPEQDDCAEGGSHGGH